MSISEKRQCIDVAHPQLSISRQCELIGLARSSFYRPEPYAGGESEENLALMRLIEEEYTRYPFTGVRRMTGWLRKQGHQVNSKRIHRLMRQMGLRSILPGPNTSAPRKNHKKYPYLINKMNIIRPNQAWATDITYIRLRSGFVYLTAVLDWHSRFVLSWEISTTMETEFCTSAVERAIRCYGHKPEVFNTDQGSQYTSDEFTGMLTRHGIKISMDGKGRWADNVLVERLWRTVKYEEIRTKEYESVGELIAALRTYFDYYNFERAHSSLGGATPAEAHFGESASRKAA